MTSQNWGVSFHTIIMTINHKKVHQDISIGSKVFHWFVFQRHISKPEISNLWYAVYQRWLIFALLEGRWNTKWLITLGLTQILWWNYLWLITLIMVWNDDEIVGVAASLSLPCIFCKYGFDSSGKGSILSLKQTNKQVCHAHLTKASADFKYYSKKLGRRQKFSKNFC